PRIAGSVITAWLVSVPYHATRPRSSRDSVEPIKAIQATAVGPPSTAAAISGAVETTTWTPSETRTGRDEAINVTIVQNAKPARMSRTLTLALFESTWIAIAGSTGIQRLVASKPAAAAPTSPAR